MFNRKDSSSSEDSNDDYYSRFRKKPKPVVKEEFVLNLPMVKQYLIKYFDQNCLNWWAPEENWECQTFPQSNTSFSAYRKQRSIYTHRIYLISAQLFELLKPKRKIESRKIQFEVIISIYLSLLEHSNFYLELSYFNLFFNLSALSYSCF